LQAGEELNYDYGLMVEERHTAKLKAEYACYRGAANCRGTMLAPKRAGSLRCLTAPLSGFAASLSLAFAGGGRRHRREAGQRPLSWNMLDGVLAA
jgi:hypothetical protein